MEIVKAKTVILKNGKEMVINYQGEWAMHLDENDSIIQVDIDGMVIERPKSEYPYNYSSFCIFNIEKDKLAEIEKNKNPIYSIYTDRMFMANPDRYNRLSLEIFGDKSQYFNSRSPKKIEAFLQEFYSDKSLQLIKIIESCNSSTGYPCWYFKYSTD